MTIGGEPTEGGSSVSLRLSSDVRSLVVFPFFSRELARRGVNYQGGKVIDPQTGRQAS